MTDPTPPEDSEPTSFAENAKNWYQKHKTKIRAVGAVTLIAGLGVIAHLAERSNTKAWDAEDSAPPPTSELSATPKRKGHNVPASVVKLPAGQQASEQRRAAYREATGEDLPAGSTYRSEHRRGASEEDETRGDEAA
ncbi:hypothetical protein [Actinomadura litoris]|uniref:Uncharacterized protein n=1 Tax=Actinomadura litoris TaxID=2678616 RepID=A0A7K1KSC1_9ACTN|nr:hypothetical protein [Actinomadura litoris]MUN35062.1 hypothetical protein [Actinomadura litoris]